MSPFMAPTRTFPHVRSNAAIRAKRAWKGDPVCWQSNADPSQGGLADYQRAVRQEWPFDLDSNSDSGPYWRKCQTLYSCPRAKPGRTYLLTSANLTHARVDQNGSLVAPKALQEMFARHARGQATDAQLRGAQDEAIRDVVSKQEAIGWPIITDGELRRRNFQESFSAAVTGFDIDLCGDIGMYRCQGGRIPSFAFRPGNGQRSLDHRA
jgi:hypothetical protein